MFTFPILLIFVIGIIAIMGWLSLKAEHRQNTTNNTFNYPNIKNRQEMVQLEMGTEISPFIEKTKASQIQVSKELIKVELKEELTIEQHLQKINQIENQIIMGLINELESQTMRITKELNEINWQINIITLLYYIEDELKKIEYDLCSSPYR